MNEHAVNVSNVSRHFSGGGGGVQALRDVSLDVEQGQEVAIIGPSGSGKTTLLNLVGALDRPDEGRIACFGHDLTRMSEREAASFRRRHVGFVFQEDALMPELTVHENIELPLILVGENPAARRKRVGELLEALGLLDRALAYPPTLSGGEKQRVAIARAVAHRPRLLLADEPTANLDGASADRVIHTLEAMARDNEVTVLLATHDPRVFERFPTIISLEDGQLAGVRTSRS